MAARLSIQKRRESSLGFHYFNLYQCCPRKFYLRYVKRYRNRITAQPLVGGSAFHEGLASFYLGGTEREAIDTAMGILNASRKELASDDVFKELEFRIPNLLHFYIAEFGARDRKQFKFLHVEKELSVPIRKTGSDMTIRPDLVAQDKSSRLVYIFEHKTSGFSHRVTEEGVRYGDQATAYLFGVTKATKLKPYGVIPNIAYWNKQTRDLQNMKFIRGDIVFRSDYEIEMFEMGISQLLSEINQKVAAYVKGFDPRLLFPRNSYYCMSFSTPCQYVDCCGCDAEKLTAAPRGFIIDKAIKKTTSLVEDPLGT